MAEIPRICSYAEAEGIRIPEKNRKMKKNLSEIKGFLHSWTRQSAEWYDRASKYTGYHDRLVSYILKYIEPGYSCFEIACGTGNMGLALAPHMSKYTAVDSDSAACGFFREKLAEKGSPDISLACSDWKAALEGGHYDLVITSFFGAEIDDWDLIEQAADHRFIAIVPRRKKNDRGAGDGISGRHGERLESYDQMKVFSDARGLKYDAEPLDIEFGQPFESMDEAREYVRYYYSLEGEDIESFLRLKLVRKQDGTLYFPKVKKAGIIAVHTDGK